MGFVGLMKSNILILVVAGLAGSCNADSSENEEFLNEAAYAGQTVQAVYGIQYQRDLCIRFFPASRKIYSDSYENSSLPKFHKYLPDPINPMTAESENMSNEEVLNSLFQTQGELKLDCEKDYIESIKSFDKDSDQALSRIQQYIKIMKIPGKIGVSRLIGVHYCFHNQKIRLQEQGAVLA
jgi:hypothetical protein